MKFTLSSIFSACFLLIACCAVAQDKGAAAPQDKKKDSAKALVVEVPAGLRIGTDLSRIAMHFFQPYRTDATITLDARYRDRIFFASDISWNRTSHSDTLYNYKGNGMAISLGVNYNLLKKQVPKENFMLFAGMKYGFALFNYELPNYEVPGSYWGDFRGSLASSTKTAHWIEVSVGMKVEVLKNFYLGWSIQDRLLLTKKISKGDYPPMVIPGFGKGNKGNVFDMQYTVSYLLPMWKVKQKMSLP
ncbi:DUF6048 family protein [Chitinophaga rhizosphaerae]|uniref:DUF6048 family protein n=1 Tax=Chitinophaga rhizosphaerae TaxID=1864947 RepID=UPI000F810A22|nr:DUF6048 family protein [Chitinophaga rhizosphaerae]